MKKYKTSLIIPTLGRPDNLRNCLDSLLVQTLPPDEVIVVDQSSDDSIKNILNEYQQKHSQVIQTFVYAHQEQKSSARARNFGISLATGEIICFTDDDIILNPDYFEKVLGYFKDPQVGGVAGNVLNPPSMVQFKSRIRMLIMRIFLISSFDGKMSASGFGLPIFERKIDQVLEVELYSGYSMNFRRELILADPFDDWFEGYSFREDVDVSYRISRKAKLLMVPDAYFLHNHSYVGRTDIKTLKKMQLRNYRYVFLKHKNFNVFSRILFGYSVIGLIVQDLLELLLNINKPERRQSFIATLEALTTRSN